MSDDYGTGYSKPLIGSLIEPTDPRAALADVLLGGDSALLVERRLAERGVLLVTEERLAAALDATEGWYATRPNPAAAIFAALSGEASE